MFEKAIAGWHCRKPSAHKAIMTKSAVGWLLACSSNGITLRMLITAERCFTKPNWVGCIKLGRTLANLLAIIFNNILASRIIKDMGLYDDGRAASYPGFGESFIYTLLSRRGGMGHPLTFPHIPPGACQRSLVVISSKTLMKVNRALALYISATFLLCQLFLIS